MVEAYLKDTPYIWGCYSELSPRYLNYICALNGHCPRDLDQDFTYCELGSGNGVTVTALAELFPQGSFHAVDFNDIHIDNSNALLNNTKLDNLNFYEMDFNDLTSLPGSDFDYIVMHGVYSWVGAETRDKIRAFVGRRLKEGGIVYISYDSLPGWASIAPMRDLVMTYTAAMTDDSMAKTRAGLDFLEFLKNNKSAFFKDNPTASAFLDQLKDHPLDYISHEFYGDTVKPVYFQDVANYMRSVGVVFSGRDIPHLNFVDLAAPAEFHGLLKKSASRIEFETYGDFIRNQRFRRDVFIKSQDTLSEEAQQDLLMNTPFGSICVEEDFKRSVAFGDVALNYVADLFENLIRELCAGTKTVTQLSQMDQFAGYGPELILDGIRFLTAGGQIVPFSQETTAPSDAELTANRYALRGTYNLEILKLRLLAQDAIGMAAMQAGITVEVAMSDALFALCSVEAEREQVSDWAFQRLLEKGQQMVTEEEDETAALAEAVEQFRRKRLPKFLEFGILDPTPE